MQLPKAELYPTKSRGYVPIYADVATRVRLNALTLAFWDSWTAICNEANVDVELQWHKQRQYLYDLFYRARGYVRRRAIKKDGRRKNHRKPKADLEFTKTWNEFRNGN